MSEGLLLKGGRVVDPAQGLDGPRDVLLRDGRVAEVGSRLSARGAETPARSVHLDCVIDATAGERRH